MRVAAIYDVHGNLPALEAVLEEVERERVDAIVVGGDVASGPMPGETLERLYALGERALFVRGNADRELVDAVRRPERSPLERERVGRREDRLAGAGALLGAPVAQQLGGHRITLSAILHSVQTIASRHLPVVGRGMLLSASRHPHGCDVACAALASGP